MITLLIQPAEKKSYLRNPVFKILSLLFTLAWCCFYLTARDKANWWLENILVILFITGLCLCRKKITFSDKSLVLIFSFLILHIYGAKMAYTQNELGEWMQNYFQLQRNPYDRIVHFSFGFLLLYPITEMLSGYFPRQKYFVLMLANMFIVCLATAFELVEWGVAEFTDKATGETYVATQGDPWDAQKDIILALLGSLLFSMLLKIKKIILRLKLIIDFMVGLLKHII